MNMVGPDKRLNYYRLTPDEVITALHSHKMGLTNTEAKRRADVQQNILSSTPVRPLVVRYALQAQPLVLLVLLTTLGLAVALGDTLLAAALATLLLAHLVLTWATWSGRQSTNPSFASLLPGRAHVVRNGQTESIATSSIVVGDLVHLQAGDIVPADMRLIKGQDLVANDAVILGGDTHVRKFIHALQSDVPLAARNNLAFAGTTIISGEAHGIVIAAGEQTELGRIQQLAEIQSRKATRLEKQLQRQRRALVLGGGALLVFVALTTAQAEPVNATRVFLLALVAVAACILPFLSQLASLVTKRRAARDGITISGLRDIETVSQADILLGDPITFSEDNAAVTSFAIGRTIYAVDGKGYQPNGRILDSGGKLVTKKALRELSLFFEAATLAHHASALAPDAHHSTWHRHGDPVDAALLTAARRAGLQTEQLRDRHELLGIFPLDAHRQLQGIVRQYGDDRVLFTIGSPEALLTRSAKVWDHGHVRPLSARDTAHFTAHHTRQAATGLTCIALAYRILPKNINIQNLSMESAEQKLTLLGIMDVEHEAHAHVRTLLHAAHGSHLKISLLTNRPTHYAINSERLRLMSNERLLERLRRGSATFSQLTADDKLRLVSVAQQAHHTVAMCGSNLSDLPALRLADLAFRSPATTSPWLKQTATVSAEPVGSIVHAAPSARVAAGDLAHIFRMTAVGQFAVLILGFLSAAATVFLHIPLGITPLQLLALLVVLQPLSAATILGQGGSKTGISLRATTILGASAACIAFANFLAFFVRDGISPEYLDATSRLAAHATTLALVSLVMAQWVDMLLDLRMRAPLRRPHLVTLAAGVAGIAMVTGIIYLEPLQALLGTQSLDPVDWVCLLLGAALYVGAHLFGHHNQHHSRHAVIRLHHQKFGRSSPLRI